MALSDVEVTLVHAKGETTDIFISNGYKFATSNFKNSFLKEHAMGIEHNLRLAELAVRHVKNVLPLGSSNSIYSPAPEEALMANTVARSELAIGRSDFHLERVTAHAKASGAGNCKEMAMVAFTFLRSRLAGSSSLDLVGVNSPQYGMHMYVAIGRAFAWPVAPGQETIPTNVGSPSTWGTEVAICDPWLCLWDIANNANNRDGVYTIPKTMSLYRLGASRAAEL